MPASWIRVDTRLRHAFEAGTLPKQLIVSGPAGTGKTRGILTFLHCLAADYPGLRILILRKTRNSLTQTVLVTLEREVFPADGMESLADGPTRANRQSYVYPNGSEIALAGLDKPEKAFSSAWDIIYVCEAVEVSEDAWEKLSTRLNRPGSAPWLGFLIGDTNPGPAKHWIKQRTDRGASTRWETTHEANPAMHDGRGWTPRGRQYLAELDKLTGYRYQRLRLGKWVGAEGLVYDLWQPDLHLIDPFPIPRSWRRFRSIDFGYVNPFVCQWWAVDHDGRMFLYRELYRARRTVRRHCQTIRQVERWHLLGDDGRPLADEGTGEPYGNPFRERIDATVCDHDAEDRATLREEGIDTRPARKDITRGIQKVQERLKRGDDGRPRLYIFRGCLIERDPSLEAAGKPCCTAEEIDGYVWAPSPEGKPEKEVPLDVDDHGMDALRYAVMHRDGRREAEVLL